MKAVFVDIETTGLDFEKHVALDLCVAIVNLDVRDEMHTFMRFIRCSEQDWENADPEAMKINNILRDAHDIISSSIESVASDLAVFLEDHGIVRDKAFFICQNPSFDRVFFHRILPQRVMSDLNMPYHWLDLASMYWSKYYACCYPTPEEISLSKDSIARCLGLEEEPKPHTSLGGVHHLIKCYNRLNTYNFCDVDEGAVFPGFKRPIFK